MHYYALLLLLVVNEQGVGGTTLATINNSYYRCLALSASQSWLIVLDPLEYHHVITPFIRTSPTQQVPGQ
jgi:hypothetical protein